MPTMKSGTPCSSDNRLIGNRQRKRSVQVSIRTIKMLRSGNKRRFEEMNGTWLITGCSSGIGRGIAEAALEAGQNVVVTARRPETVQDIIKGYEDTAMTLALDVSREDQIRAAVAAAVERFGSIDVLVNNAGYGYRSAIEESEWTEINKLFEVNCFGPVRLIQEVLPVMRAQRSGVIVNVTSIGGIRGAVGNGMYSAAKGAFELASDTLYKECAPLGIKVLTVEPGAFRTSFYGSLKGTGKKIGDYAETAGKWHIENMVDKHDQMGNPEVAGKVLVDVVLGGEMPQRLPLGSDAVGIIRRELTARLAELEKWEKISASTDYAEYGNTAK